MIKKFMVGVIAVGLMVMSAVAVSGDGGNAPYLVGTEVPGATVVQVDNERGKSYAWDEAQGLCRAYSHYTIRGTDIDTTDIMVKTTNRSNCFPVAREVVENYPLPVEVCEEVVTTPRMWDMTASFTRSGGTVYTIPYRGGNQEMKTEVCS